MVVSRWTVLGRGPKRGNHTCVWCRCQCGSEELLRVSDLTQPRARLGCHSCVPYGVGGEGRTAWQYLPGAVIGRWVVLRREPAGKGRKPHAVWCRCECGVEELLATAALSSPSAKRGCNACWPRNARPSTPLAARYGHWTVLGEVGNRYGRNRYVRCRCDCGPGQWIKPLTLLHRGKSRGCKRCHGTGDRANWRKLAPELYPVRPQPVRHECTCRTALHAPHAPWCASIRAAYQEARA